MAEGAAPRKRAASRAKVEELVVDGAPVEVVEAPAVPAGVKYVAGRRMLFNGVWYEQGDPVPDAESARRIETLIANRYLKRVTA